LEALRQQILQHLVELLLGGVFAGLEYNPAHYGETRRQETGS